MGSVKKFLPNVPWVLTLYGVLLGNNYMKLQIFEVKHTFILPQVIMKLTFCESLLEKIYSILKYSV